MRRSLLRGECDERSFSTYRVADTDETIADVVADQDGSVRQLQHVGRTAVGSARRTSSTGGARSRTRQEAVYERFVTRHPASIGVRRRDAIAARGRSVPRTMLGDDRRVLVAGRKHVAGVEREANRRHVGAKLLDGRLSRRTRALRAELGIRHVALMAVWKAEVQAGLVRHIELVVRHVVAEHVAAVVGKPQFVRRRMPGKADAVADALGERLESG